MGRGRIDWSVPAQAFLGAYRESGNKFLDFRLTQEEQRKTSDRAAAKAITNQMKSIHGDGYTPSDVTAATEFGRSKMAELLSPEARKIVERYIDNIEVVGQRTAADKRRTYESGTRLRSEGLESLMAKTPVTGEGFLARAEGAEGIRLSQLEAKEAFTPYAGATQAEGVLPFVGERAGALRTGSVEMADALEGFPWPFKEFKLEDSENLERIYTRSGGLPGGFSSWLADINRINKNSSEAKILDFINRREGNLELAAKSGWIDPAYMSANIAEGYNSLLIERERTKSNAAESADYSTLLNSLGKARQNKNIGLAQHALDIYGRDTGNKQSNLAKQALITTLTPGLPNIVHMDADKSYESYMRQVMMSLLRGDIKGKFNEDTNEYEAPNVNAVYQSARELYNTFNPGQQVSTTIGRARSAETYMNLASSIENRLDKFQSMDDKVAYASKVREGLNASDPNFLIGIRNQIGTLPKEVSVALFGEAQLSPFISRQEGDPGTASNQLGPAPALQGPWPQGTDQSTAVGSTAAAQAPPVGQPVEEQDDRSFGYSLGAGAAELAREAVTPGGMWPPPSMSNIGDAVARGSNALVRFGSDLIEGASGVNPREVLREEERKARDFWVGGTDKVLEGASLIRYEEMRKLNELGYSKDDLEVLSYREIKDILQNKVPRPSDFQTSQPKGFLERSREVVEPLITSAVSSLQQPEVGPQDLGWPPLQVRLRLQELGYNIEHIRSLSPEEISAIVEKSIPAPQAR